MAAYTHPSCHVVKKEDGSVAQGEQPSVVCGKRSAGCGDDVGDRLGSTAGPNPNRSPLCSVESGPMSKKAKVHHLVKSVACSKSYAAVAEQRGDILRMASPTDVRSHDEGWGSQASAKMPATVHNRVMSSKMPSNGQFNSIKTLPPTLKGISDAAAILHASKLSPSASASGSRSPEQQQQQQQVCKSKNNYDSNAVTTSSPTPLLLSFPTESVYMLACATKTASSRSIRRLLSSRKDSHTSLSSSCSSEKGGNFDPTSYGDSFAAHQEGSLSLMNSVHPKNASLEWMANCNQRASASSANGMAPILFVLDEHHALNFCHFTKPKTYAIRPPSLSLDSNKKTDCGSSGAVAPSTPPNRSSTKQNSFSPLPVFGVSKSLTSAQKEEPTTPKTATDLFSPISSPVGPSSHKLCAANFSESREVFLRLASKFWPGPVILHVQVRTLGEDGASTLNKSHKLSSSSVSTFASIPSLPSEGDLVAVGNLQPLSEAARVPVLPTSALVSASQLFATKGEVQDGKRYFVGMQCPSHPLPRKILNEIYCGPARHSLPSASTENIPSSLPADDRGQNKVSQQKLVSKRDCPRTSVAVVGCMVHGPKISVSNSAATTAKASESSTPIQATCATTAADCQKAIDSMLQSTAANNGEEKQGQFFIVNGEDNRESFMVPTCQYGGPHPVSLVIDGDNRTVHLIRRGQDQDASNTDGIAAKGSRFTKDSIYRALLKPASSSNIRQSMNFGRSHSHDGTSENKGDSTSIDRVITAVLSRWKIQESIINS